MKKLSFMLVLVPLFSLVILGNKKNETVGFDIEPKIDQEFCGRFSRFISKKQDWSLIRPNSLKQKKIFVGESLSMYNSDDYYLWVDAYDVDGNNIDDLIAIDWHKRNRKDFYLAYYVFADMGGIMSKHRELRKYFLSVKLKKRHGSGYTPWFPERIQVMDKQERMIDESFVGFHEIKPVFFENKVLVIAKKKNVDSSKSMLFSFDATESKINLLCDFNI